DGSRWLYFEGSPKFLFTQNETNKSKLVNAVTDSHYVKDVINDYVVHGVKTAVNPEPAGTKTSAHYAARVPPGKSFTMRLRLSPVSPTSGTVLDGEFEKIFTSRRTEADEFYRTVIPDVAADEKAIMRQALGSL